ncbi:DUF4178 domain-containing protein [Saccharopolyspora rhizosphaerae]|uniref:DUF4178 domain-containing protein n=1 Tax=Saccharopolyspora rhizosphaerae TaxID=2492662 RepID=A0A426JVS9_9PSEU|nr:DUF4178 domain-containing protein [Saccharopolyspora rhizosphaerae]RRO17289.1 DUF4178 domain-containing protein [Saccharopolyspora rhizosphaerae]
MTALLVVLVLLLIAVAVVAVVLGMRARGAERQGESGAAAPQDPFGTGDQDSLRGDPRGLKAGDIVEIRSTTYTVRGSLRLDEGGWSWSEHLLDDSKGAQVWLGVEEDPDLVLTMWTPVTGVGAPGAPTLEHEGRTYRSGESGSASFRSEATTGLDAEGTVRYHDYESSDGALLGFESYGGAAWEATAGEKLGRYDVFIYPTAD